MKTSIFCFGFLLLFIACNSQEVNYSFKENYTIAGPARINLSASDGNVEIIATEGKVTEVIYIVQKNRSIVTISKEELAEKGVIITAVPGLKNLDISIKYPLNYWGGNYKDKYYVDFKIYLPKNTECNLKTSDGNISVTGIESDVSCKTSDGNIQINQIIGNVSLKASDGNIDLNNITGMLSIVSSDGNVRANTIEGNISANSSDGSKSFNHITGNLTSISSDGNLKINDLTGNITTVSSDGNTSIDQLIGSLDSRASDGNITVHFLELTQSLNIQTSDGNIDVSIANSQGLDLNIQANSLNIPLKNFNGESTNKKIIGTVNDGGPSVRIKTSDGRIMLDY